MSKLSVKNLTALALLTALEIILSRFLSVNAWNMKIGFSFVPLVLAGVLFGPVQAGIVGALSDFLGAILFPIGAYFPGFTLTQFLAGLVFGLLLHKNRSFLRILGAVAVQQLLLGLLLNTYWISVLYTSPYVPLLATRLVQSGVLTAVELIVIPLLLRSVPRLERMMNL